MNDNRYALTAALTTALGAAAPATDAADHVVVLTAVSSYSNSGTSAVDITSSTATFSYDDTTNLVTQTGGVYNGRLSIVPNVSTLFRHTITGLVMGNGGAASASSYRCINGNFGQSISFANLCGNYNFGANFVEESTISYGPGTAYARTIGGDDVIAFNINGGIPQNIAQLDGMTSAGLVGAILTLSNAVDLSTAPGKDTGYDWIFNNDIDGDGVENSLDNCTLVANAGQCDSDGDGYGNHCDGDLNNNTATNAQDYVLFRQQLGQPSVAPAFNQADINCSGAVNSQDYVLFRGLLGMPSGPSGLHL
jgi:hypothetical protein